MQAFGTVQLLQPWSKVQQLQPILGLSFLDEFDFQLQNIWTTLEIFSYMIYVASSCGSIFFRSWLGSSEPKFTKIINIAQIQT